MSDFVLASYTFGCAKMSDFVPHNRHLREVLIFFYHSRKTAAEVHGELQKVYRAAALSETTYRDWFLRFKDGDFVVDDRPREGKLKTFEDAELEALLDDDPCQTQEELASALGVTRQAIGKPLYALGMSQKQGTWVPYDLKGFEAKGCGASFFRLFTTAPAAIRKGFLHHIVTGDEKLIH